MSATRIGSAAMAPCPRPSEALETLVNGALDSQLSRRAASSRHAYRRRLVRVDLAMGRERFDAFVPRPDTAPMPDGFGVNAQVRIVAVVGARYNTRRQIVGTHFQVPSLAQLVVETPAAEDPFALPIEPVGEILSFETRDRAGVLTHIKGNVLAAQGAWLYVRDDTGTVQVFSRERHLASAGDVIEAVGFPRASGFTPILEDARLRRIGGSRCRRRSR